MGRFGTLTIAALIALYCLIVMTHAINVKFTKLECEEYDKSFATFKKCRLKALARHTVAMYVHVQLHQVPVNNVTVNAQLFKRGNGFRPHLYNNTADFCEFLHKPNRYMFWKILFRYVQAVSNINHSCPFNHDIIVNRMILDGSMLRLIPGAINDYMVRVKVAAYNHYKAEVRAYVSLYN